MRALPLLSTTGLPLLLGLSCLFYDGVGHRFWRAHAGDTFIVAFLVGLLGVLTKASLKVRIGIIALLSASIELSQLSSWGANRSGLLKLALGTHFDPWDFLYYALGLLLATALHRISKSPQLAI